MNHKAALLLGASGSVGKEVLKVLMEEASYQKVIVFVRQPLNIDIQDPQKKLVQKILPKFSSNELFQVVCEVLTELANHNSEVVGFSTLGIGANTARLTIDQHRAVDVELNKAFAQALKTNRNVKSLEFMSAVGANPKASASGSGAAGMPRYARVKGEAEEAVQANGPLVVNIYRPSTIRGSQHTPKTLAMITPIIDALIPSKYHSISAHQIAKAMLIKSLQANPTSQVLHYREMINLYKL